MRQLFLEVVPRTETKFTEEIESVRHLLPQIHGINIPYTKGCDLGPIEALDLAQNLDIRRSLLPHIRARDYVKTEGRNVISHTDESIGLIRALIKRGVRDILVVQGDPHEGEGDNPDISPAFIKYIKGVTSFRVFGAIDQYRNGDELNRIAQKLGAGADGFFTQPFFDRVTLEKSMDTWHALNVYYGFAPVTTEKSMAYWKTVNNVTFPKNFSLSVEANIDFARENVRLLHAYNQGAYLMPVKFSAKTYLEGVLKK